MKAMLLVLANRQTQANLRLTQEANADTGNSRGLVTVVFSPRGGAGKSSIAANLGVVLAQGTPDRVALIDLDLLFPHQSILLNLQPSRFLSNVSPGALKSMDRESFSYYLSSHEESSLRVLTGGRDPADGENVSADHVRLALDVIRRQYVQVIVDTGPNFSDPTLAAIEQADRVLLVCTPELTSVRDARECTRIFFELLGFPKEHFVLVLNHISPYKGLPNEQIEEALDMDVAFEIPFGGDVPSQAALEGNPVMIRYPNHPVAKALGAIATELDRAARESAALSGGR